MTNKPENPPAFPCEHAGSFHPDHAPGMTLRDYFAGQVVAVSFQNFNDAVLAGNDTLGDKPLGESVKLIAKTAYLVADAMLAARGE